MKTKLHIETITDLKSDSRVEKISLPPRIKKITGFAFWVVVDAFDAPLDEPYKFAVGRVSISLNCIENPSIIDHIVNYQKKQSVFGKYNTLNECINTDIDIKPNTVMQLKWVEELHTYLALKLGANNYDLKVVLKYQ